MLCSNCGKREVEVLIKQVIDQEVHDLNLCRACAEEMGFISPDAPSITISFSLNEADRRGVKKKAKAIPENNEADVRNDALVCTACGMEYAAFRENGVLGCPECYAAFRFPLGAFLQRNQGAESHWGGMSGMFAELEVVEDAEKAAIRKRIDSEWRATVQRLESELADAVEREEYERAAKLRDVLRSLGTKNREE